MALQPHNGNGSNGAGHNGAGHNGYKRVPIEPRTPELDDPAESEPVQESANCPKCGYGFITRTNGKRKLRTRVLVFTENGNAMGICPKCKTNLKVPVAIGTNTIGSNSNAKQREGDTK